jgi:gluconolactonase
MQFAISVSVALALSKRSEWISSSGACLASLLLLTFASCTQQTVVTIERLDPELDKILSVNASAEILAEGFAWSEGPLWIEEEQMLLFSDVPTNTIHKWTEARGLETYLTPSGYTLIEKGSGAQGSNGLLLNAANQLVLCQHGDRRVAVMNAPLSSPAANFISLAADFKGQRFNSPNDAVYRSNGDLFFTDPPYGFELNNEDTLRQLAFNGVYKVDTAGTSTLLVDSIERPNGIALLNNEKTLLIANSYSSKARWYAYDLAANDSLTNGRIYYDATVNATVENGLPDGLKVNEAGVVFASGPGGIWIFNASGKLIGKIKTTTPSANCALGQQGKALFITSEKYLLRVSLL